MPPQAAGNIGGQAPPVEGEPQVVGGDDVANGGCSPGDWPQRWPHAGSSRDQQGTEKPALEPVDLTPEEHRAAAATALDAAGEEGLAGIVRAWAELPEAVRLALATLAGGQS